MKYKIIEHNVYNEYCVIEKTYYTVEELISGWFGKRYRVLQHGECYGQHVCQTVTTFETHLAASAMIERLSEGTPRDRIVSQEIK